MFVHALTNYKYISLYPLQQASAQKTGLPIIHIKSDKYLYIYKNKISHSKHYISGTRFQYILTRRVKMDNIRNEGDRTSPHRDKIK
jgi:hypothetical protein